MLVHNVEMTVFAKDPDNLEDIQKKLLEFFPFDLEEEKIEVYKKNISGLEDKKIVILKVELSKQRHVKLFLNDLLGKLAAEQKKLLLKQKETRLDEELNFFIRFDKPKIMAKGGLFITDSGNCFHLRMKIAAFPAKREQALEAIEKIFKVE